MRISQERHHDPLSQDIVLSSSGDEEPTHIWSFLLQDSLKKILRWQIPPRWTDLDWREEVRSEVMLAALQAHQDFDSSRGVPWEAFLRQRVVHAALARYRREWSYSLRITARTQTIFQTGVEKTKSSETTRKKLLVALQRLPRGDVNLIESLFWGSKTESELARGLGISQQAVNKRKRVILKRLHRTLDSMEVTGETEI